MSKPYAKGYVIPRRFYQHRQNPQRTASLYGSAPWTGAPGNTESDWELVERGFSIRAIDHRGVQTITGPQYAPYKLDTREEAFAYAEKIALEAFPLRV